LKSLLLLLNHLSRAAEDLRVASWFVKHLTVICLRFTSDSGAQYLLLVDVTTKLVIANKNEARSVLTVALTKS
jgi:hypothetical protein